VKMTTMRIRQLMGMTALAGLASMSFGLAGGALAHPPETTGVEAFVSGNPTCLSIDPESGLTEFKIDSGELVSGFHGDGTLQVEITLSNNPLGQLLDWVSNLGIDSVVVKGGPSANRYTYNPEAFEDQGLHSPQNNSGKYANVSHISFCYDVDTFEGCTKGYWGRDQHFDSWPLDYTITTTLVGAGFTPAPTPEHTLLVALGYSGGPGLSDKKNLMLAQAVPALLNAAHPDVNYAFTVPQVLTAANAALISANVAFIESTQAAFDAANNNGCPLD
jgi:hypothetical protein